MGGRTGGQARSWAPVPAQPTHRLPLWSLNMGTHFPPRVCASHWRGREPDALTVPSLGLNRPPPHPLDGSLLPLPHCSEPYKAPLVPRL